MHYALGLGCHPAHSMVYGIASGYPLAVGSLSRISEIKKVRVCPVAQILAAGHTPVGWDWVVVVQGTGSLEAHARELGSKSLFLFAVVKLAPPQCLFLLHARKGHLAQERGHCTGILLVPRHTRCTDRKLRSGPFQRTIGRPERRGLRVSVPCTPELRSFLRKWYLVPQHIQFCRSTFL